MPVAMDGDGLGMASAQLLRKWRYSRASENSLQQDGEGTWMNISDASTILDFHKTTLAAQSFTANT